MGSGGCQTRVKGISLGGVKQRLTLISTKALGKDSGQGHQLCQAVFSACFHRFSPTPSLQSGRRWGQEISCDRKQTSQVHLSRVNQSAYGAKPRGGEAWHGPRAQISKILLTREPGGHFYLVHDIHGERVSPVAIVD